MNHQRSFVHHFFPIKVQVLENIFVDKSCLINESSHKN